MDLQYPIGKFAWNRTGEGLLASEAERQEWLADIEELPARLRAAVAGLTEAQLDTPYRPGGWTVRPSGASPRGQPHELLRAQSPGAHRGRTHH